MHGQIVNLHPDLFKILTELEKRMGFELQINSGYRDPEHNHDVGGVDGSEHTYDPAEGADVFCQRSVTRFKMVRELYDMKVSRIGIGDTFVHVGIAKDKPQNAMWAYYPAKHMNERDMAPKSA